MRIREQTFRKRIIMNFNTDFENLRWSPAVFNSNPCNHNAVNKIDYLWSNLKMFPSLIIDLVAKFRPVINGCPIVNSSIFLGPKSVRKEMSRNLIHNKQFPMTRLSEIFRVTISTKQKRTHPKFNASIVL